MNLLIQKKIVPTTNKIETKWEIANTQQKHLCQKIFANTNKKHTHTHTKLLKTK